MQEVDFCSVKGCPFEAVHWLKDINETIPVCSQHGEFFHEEAGYFDPNIRLSFLSHSSSAMTLGSAFQDDLHPNIGRRLRMPSRLGRLNISNWANRRAAKRERERRRERAIVAKLEKREVRFQMREQRLLMAIERLERKKAEYKFRGFLRDSWMLRTYSRFGDPVRALWRAQGIPITYFRANLIKHKEIWQWQRYLRAEQAKEAAAIRYIDLHIRAKWTPLAEKLAQLEIGQDFFVLKSRPLEYARLARMGLNANRASSSIPRSIITRPTGVIVRRVAEFGHWSKHRWDCQWR